MCDFIVNFNIYIITKFVDFCVRNCHIIRVVSLLLHCRINKLIIFIFYIIRE